MSSRTATRLLGALAVPALGLGLVACSSEEPANETAGGNEEEAVAALSPQEAVLASVSGLDDSSYKMESNMTVNGLDFMLMTGEYDGDASQASADILMSAILEASGQEMSAEEQAMMEGMFTDMHTETIVVDQVMYMQMTGGVYDAAAESFGEDAWFTVDLTSDDAIAEVYSQYGGMDLGQQTEQILTELENVEETGENTFTGTLSADSESMSALSDASGADAAAMVEGTEITVTLDDDGLLKTMTMTLPETEGMAMVLTSEIVEIGGSYDIAAPESTNLHPFEDLMAGAGM
jgi:hypothetical protein